jgi:hypothetical protein
MTDEDEDEYAGRPFGEQLIDVAEAQLEAGHFGVAIVIAQTVIESTAQLAFDILFGLNVPRSSETMLALLPDRSFANRATRTLWTELTGDDIKEPRDEWKAYTDHIERRNRAAHGAIAFSFRPSEGLRRGDAEASLKAVRDLRAY